MEPSHDNVLPFPRRKRSRRKPLPKPAEVVQLHERSELLAETYMAASAMPAPQLQRLVTLLRAGWRP